MNRVCRCVISILPRSGYCPVYGLRLSSSDTEDKLIPVAPKPTKRVVFSPERYRQPEDVSKEPEEFPYLLPDPQEDYLRRRFYPSESRSEGKTGLLAGWRQRGGEDSYGKSFRESRSTRDEYIARYGVEALNPVGKLRPLWETQDPGDLDDEKYFDEKEYIYTPLKPRLWQDVPRTMDSLVMALCRFAREGNHFLAADLLDEGADCTQFDQGLWSALHYACDRGHYQMVHLFLMKKPNINLQDYDGYSPLMLAASNGHYRVCQLLIESSAQLEFKDVNDRSALMLALLKGKDRVGALLIDSGADIHLVDKDGWNLLHWCCFNGHSDSVKLLINTKLNINQQDFKGNTPLHLAACGGFHEICKLLVQSGVDRCIQNHDGWTVGHLSVYWAQSKALMEVIQSQQDFLILNTDQQTIEEMAEDLGYHKLIQQLKIHKEKLNQPAEESKDLISSQKEALEVVTMKVRGRIFVTSKSTLEANYGSYFWLMFHPEDSRTILQKNNRRELGPGPGVELHQTGEMEYSLDRDPSLFSHILELLRHMKYSNIEDVHLPEDKYELGMLIDEAKFFRLTKVLELLKIHKKTKQIKSYRNVIPEKHRKKLMKKSPFLTDYGKPYLPPSVEVPQGNEQYREWDPIKDPFAKNIVNQRRIQTAKRKPR